MPALDMTPRTSSQHTVEFKGLLLKAVTLDMTLVGSFAQTEVSQVSALETIIIRTRNPPLHQQSLMPRPKGPENQMMTLGKETLFSHTIVRSPLKVVLNYLALQLLYNP